MGFSRQEYWSGLPFPSPGNLPDLGIEPGSPTLQTGVLTSEPRGKPLRLHEITPLMYLLMTCLIHKNIGAGGLSLGHAQWMFPESGRKYDIKYHRLTDKVLERKETKTAFS